MCVYYYLSLHFQISYLFSFESTAHNNCVWKLKNVVKCAPRTKDKTYRKLFLHNFNNFIVILCFWKCYSTIYYQTEFLSSCIIVFLSFFLSFFFLSFFFLSFLLSFFLLSCFFCFIFAFISLFIFDWLGMESKFQNRKLWAYRTVTGSCYRKL